MADDQQPQDSQNIPASIPPANQTTSPASFSQSGDTQTSDTAKRPESTELAVEETVPSEQIVVSPDIERPVSPSLADESKPPPSNQPSEPPPPVAHDKSTDESQVAGEQSEPQVVADENQPVSSSTDQRPNSPKMADEKLADDKPAEPQQQNQQLGSSTPADSKADAEQPQQLVDSDTIQLEPSASADLPSPSADSSIPSIPQIPPTESVSSIPADSLPSNSLPTSPPEPIISSSNSANPPSESTTSIPEEKPPESPPQQHDTNVSLTDNQTPQVQSVAPKDTPRSSAEQTASQSAEIKPEPLESPQEVPMADNNPQNSSQKSFGDLLSEVNPSPTPPTAAPPTPSIPSTPPISSSLPPVSSPTPSVSFGDLIKDIEITPPPIPEVERPVEQQPIQPHQSQPKTPPQVSPAPSTPQSPSLSQSSQLDQSNQSVQEPKVSEKVVEKIVEKPVEVIKEMIKEVPVVNQQEVKRQIDERLRLEQTQRRQLAQQAKIQRITKNLEKILELARTKGYITNLDVRELLHISQSAATNYLSQLVKSGKLIKEGKSKYIRYHL